MPVLVSERRRILQPLSCASAYIRLPLPLALHFTLCCVCLTGTIRGQATALHAQSAGTGAASQLQVVLIAAATATAPTPRSQMATAAHAAHVQPPLTSQHANQGQRHFDDWLQRRGTQAGGPHRQPLPAAGVERPLGGQAAHVARIQRERPPGAPSLQASVGQAGSRVSGSSRRSGCHNRRLAKPLAKAVSWQRPPQLAACGHTGCAADLMQTLHAAGQPPVQQLCRHMGMHAGRPRSPGRKRRAPCGPARRRGCSDSCRPAAAPRCCGTCCADDVRGRGTVQALSNAGEQTRTGWLAPGRSLVMRAVVVRRGAGGAHASHATHAIHAAHAIHAGLQSSVAPRGAGSGAGYVAAAAAGLQSVARALRKIACMAPHWL